MNSAPAPNTFESFATLWRSFGCESDGSGQYEWLRDVYQEPGRFYHNWQHLTECLTELAACRQDFVGYDLSAIEMALWYHDSVYDTKANDNEERSAQVAAEVLHSAKVNSNVISKVEQLILATKRHDAFGDRDAALMLDIDLSILCKTSERFWEYESQIRAEYEWVPLSVFNQKRAEILQQFLEREYLYQTSRFREVYEVQARSNLKAAITRLSP